MPRGLLRLRGGMGGVEICRYSEVSISGSGSESGCYWDENFHLPKDIPPGVLGGPRNVSDVLGSLEARVEGQIVTDSGVDSAHRRPYSHHEEYDQLPPSHTLYVRNLRETVHPIRMRALLYAVFSQFGHSTLSQAQGRESSMPSVLTVVKSVIYVSCLKTKAMRGQAFVCFKHLDDAAKVSTAVVPR